VIDNLVGGERKTRLVAANKLNTEGVEMVVAFALHRLADHIGFKELLNVEELANGMDVEANQHGGEGYSG
jgi:hypothetical protein